MTAYNPTLGLFGDVWTTSTEAEKKMLRTEAEKMLHNREILQPNQSRIDFQERLKLR